MKRRTGYLLGIMGLTSMALPIFPVSTLAYPGGNGQRRGPPPEAVSACVGASQNQACQFEAPHGTVEGTCLNIHDQVACVPEGGPRRPPRGQSPQET